jgi:hypothetical protein
MQHLHQNLQRLHHTRSRPVEILVALGQVDAAASPHSAIPSAPATRRTSSEIAASESGCSDTIHGCPRMLRASASSTSRKFRTDLALHLRQDVGGFEAFNHVREYIVN